MTSKKYVNIGIYQIENAKNTNCKTNVEMNYYFSANFYFLFF